jgi:Glyoxalase superfamily protein
MRDFRDAKAMAQTLRAALTAMGFKITVSQSLELIAQAFGAADWNTLSAAIRAQETAALKSTSRAPSAAESAKSPGNPPDPRPVPPNPLLSGELESTLKQAFAYAKGRRHELTLEHLLLFLLDDATLHE